MPFSKVSRITSLRSNLINASALAAAVGSALIMLAAPAQAESEMPQVKVSFEDLNLAQDKDVKRLYTRLQQASGVVCASFSGREQYQRASYRQCYSETLAKAVEQVNASQLTRLHDSRDSFRVAQQRKQQNAS